MEEIPPVVAGWLQETKAQIQKITQQLTPRIIEAVRDELRQLQPDHPGISCTHTGDQARVGVVRFSRYGYPIGNWYELDAQGYRLTELQEKFVEEHPAAQRIEAILDGYYDVTDTTLGVIESEPPATNTTDP